jgi:iron complex transport system ATP-binding protein
LKLKIKDVVFSYASTPILKNVCMELAPSEVLGIVGPNGSGKSTLIRCIDRILKPQKGSILLDGRDIKKMGRMEIAKRMGYVPQTVSNRRYFWQGCLRRKQMFFCSMSLPVTSI